ncbi:MAG: trigger factor [Patescibacteria group bacterium]
MKTDIKNLGQSQLELTIEVSPEEILPFLQKAAVKISTNSKIEGFRPGKAPYEIIKQKFGEMAILEEALDEVVSFTYHQALKENNLITIDRPEINLEKVAPNNPLTYKAKVAILPKVTIGDYSGLHLTRTPIKVSEEQLDKVMEDLRKMRAKEKLVDRPAQTGDFLHIDFQTFLDKVPIENGQHQKYPILIGEDRFIPGFENQLIGLKTGETKEFELRFPENYFEKKMAGKLAEFKVTCLDIYELERPELNDDLAQSITGGKTATMAELKETVKNNLEQEEKNKQEQRLEIEMLDKIMEISQFEELPESIVHHEIHKMLHELEDSIAQQGLQMPDYLTSIKKTTADLEKDFEPQAEKRVKAAILSREIYQQEKMEVRDDEVDKEISEILKAYPDNPEAEKQLKSEMYRDYLKNTLGNRKVVQFLKDKIIKD